MIEVKRPARRKAECTPATGAGLVLCARLRVPPGLAEVKMWLLGLLEFRPCV
jgi:hypothetical protein